MSWLANSRISRKLAVPPVIALLALAMLVIAAYAMQLMLRADLNYLNDVSFARVEAAAQMDLALERAETGLYNVIAYAWNSVDPEGVLNRSNALQKPIRDAEAAQNRLELIAAPGDGAGLGMFFGEWKKNVAEVVEMANSDLGTALALMGPTSADYDRLAAELNRLSLETNAARDKSVAQTHERVRFATVAFAVFVLVIVVVVLVTILIVTRQIAGPVMALTHVMTRLAGGELTAEIPGVSRRDELGEMAKAVFIFRHQAEQKALLDQRLEAAMAVLEQQAATDGLTGVANRRQFDTVIDQAWRQAMRAQEPLAVLLIDADHFKKYNDTYGHVAGDSCLRSLATTILGCVLRGSDLVARYGGEEFVVLLPATDAEGAARMGDVMCAAVAALAIPHSGNPPAVVTVSIGAVSVVPPQASEPALIIRAADVALYAAKAAGRNRVEVGSATRAESSAATLV